MDDTEKTLDDVILLSYGEYDDYRVKPYRVLKPFVPRALLVRFAEDWQNEQLRLEVDKISYGVLQLDTAISSRACAYHFIAYLKLLSFIEEIPLSELWLGEDYNMPFYIRSVEGDDNIDVLDKEFKPAEQQ